MLFVSFYTLFVYSAIARYGLTLRDPIFYTLACEVFLYHSSFEVVAWYVGLITFKHVLPLLKVTNKIFLLALDTVDTISLQVSLKHSAPVHIDINCVSY